MPPTGVYLIRIVVDDISGCLPGEDDGSNLAKENKDAMEAKHDFWTTSGSFTYRHHVVNR